MVINFLIFDDNSQLAIYHRLIAIMNIEKAISIIRRSRDTVYCRNSVPKWLFISKHKDRQTCLGRDIKGDQDGINIIGHYI